ncbi:MAG: bifunctional folylpolyglutamate synthase/dihydrofolate synthase [Clostridium sp.]|uniref:bifunctional folylpolyglutamate synthase/dihydrofolate synthase n=1 Tax=Clostridium sp. TaxID=1506 RepID=UPI003F3E102A
MNYREAMEYIHKVNNFGSNYGLKRVERVLELLSNPEKKLKVIHVGGTNGKGSTTSMITEILMKEGCRVGMYTSPYLEEFEERIQINRENISKEDLASYVEKIKNVVSIVDEEGMGNVTEFEIITCLMFLYFSEKNIDFAVIEVGLGGTLDATNVVNPIVSVLTSISLDHMNILGDTLEEIAKEKCGIIKSKIPVIVYPQKLEVMRVIEKVGAKKNSEIIKVLENDAKFLKVTEDKGGIYQKVKIKGFKETYELELGLLGMHQILNCAVAIRVVEKILGEVKNIKKALKDVKWNGRLEVLKKDPLVVIDGAHNIDGIKMLKENIDIYFKGKEIYLLLGILADKQVEEMIKVIAKDVVEIIALTPNSERAELSEDLKREVEKINKNVKAFESYEEGFRYACSKAKKEDLILGTGSLYMIGALRGIITKNN